LIRRPGGKLYPRIDTTQGIHHATCYFPGGSIGTETEESGGLRLL